MSFVLKANLWHRKADKQGYSPIAISIRSNGSETYYQTDMRVRKAYWKDGKVERGETNYDVLNNRIAGILAQSEREIMLARSDGKRLTLSDVKAIVQRIADPDAAERNKGSFTAFYEAYVANIRSTGKKATGTLAIWETELRQFKTVTGTDSLPFHKITAEFLDNYHRKLATLKHDDTTIGYAPTTIHKKLKKLTQVIRLAFRKGLFAVDPLGTFDMVPYVEPETHYLTLGQTQKLAGMVYKGELDSDPTLRLVACFFLVECYSGIRFSDWHKFEVEKLMDRDRLKVRTTKTKSPVYLDLTVFTSLGKIVSYIRDNGLVFRETSQTANKYLKTIGILLGLRFPLRTHYGRHTFGTLLGEMGYSTRFISEALGVNEAVARRYIKVTRQTMHAEQERIGGF